MLVLVPMPMAAGWPAAGIVSPGTDTIPPPAAIPTPSTTSTAATAATAIDGRRHQPLAGDQDGDHHHPRDAHDPERVERDHERPAAGDAADPVPSAGAQRAGDAGTGRWRRSGAVQRASQRRLTGVNW